jgi:hypothetical protein
MTGIKRGRLGRMAAAAAGIAAVGVLAMPALAGATGTGVDKVNLGGGEPLHLTGKCVVDGKPGRVIGVIGLLHKKTSVDTSFSAWADADKDGSFAVAVKLSKTVTVEETWVAGAVCVSKGDKSKHHVVKDTFKCGRPQHPKPTTTTTAKPTKPTTTTTEGEEEETTTTTKATGSTTTTTTATEDETPTPDEVEKVIETEAAPKVQTMPTAVKATPKFTG